MQIVPQGIAADCKGHLTPALGADRLSTLGGVSRFASVYPLVPARALARRTFTYGVPDGVGKGAVVELRFARAKARGVVVDTAGEPARGNRNRRDRARRRRPAAGADRSRALARGVLRLDAGACARARRAPRADAPQGVAGATRSEALEGEAAPEQLTDEQHAAVERIVGASATAATSS